MSLLTLDLVVARYQEDLQWIDELHDIYTTKYIYNKGSPINIDNYSLPNDGREGYIYLYHVIQNYNTLADITIFTQASAWSSDIKKNKLLKTIDTVKKRKTSVIYGVKDPSYNKKTYDFTINNYKITNEENYKYNSDTSLTLSQYRPLGNWFTKHFPNETIECTSYHGIFAASRKDIQKRPVEFYKVLFAEASYKNPEIEHYFERVWKNIFSIENQNSFDEIIFSS